MTPTTAETTTTIMSTTISSLDSINWDRVFWAEVLCDSDPPTEGCPIANALRHVSPMPHTPEYYDTEEQLRAGYCATADASPDSGVRLRVPAYVPKLSNMAHIRPRRKPSHHSTARSYRCQPITPTKSWTTSAMP